jgi:hypothetical protein
MPSFGLSRHETIIQILTALSMGKLNADVGRRRAGGLLQLPGRRQAIGRIRNFREE